MFFKSGCAYFPWSVLVDFAYKGLQNSLLCLCHLKDQLSDIGAFSYFASTYNAYTRLMAAGTYNPVAKPNRVSKC